MRTLTLVVFVLDTFFLKKTEVSSSLIPTLTDVYSSYNVTLNRFCMANCDNAYIKVNFMG